VSVQLRLDGLPVDPREVAKLLAPERGALYRDLNLDPLQVAAAEEAVRAVLRGSYGRASR
jgi:hypothetical protein